MTKLIGNVIIFILCAYKDKKKCPPDCSSRRVRNARVILWNVGKVHISKNIGRAHVVWLVIYSGIPRSLLRPGLFSQSSCNRVYVIRPLRIIIINIYGIPLIFSIIFFSNIRFADVSRSLDRPPQFRCNVITKSPTRFRYLHFIWLRRINKTK